MDVPNAGTTPPPLSFAVKLNFGIGQIAEGIKTCAFGTYLLFYYNQVLGLSGDLAGLAIFIALLFDAVTDPIAGSVSDRWHSPMGRRHPFMYASAVPLAVSFALLFSPLIDVGTAGQMGLFFWMLVMTVATRLSMTLYHVPHMAIGAELSEDYDQRTVLVAIRHFFGATGFMLAYVFGLGVFFAGSEEFPNGQLDPSAYPPFALIMAVLMAATIFISAYGTRSRIPYLPQARADETRVGAMDVVREAYEAMQNTSFRWMMFGFILIIAAWGMAGVLGLYVYTFFWQIDNLQILFIVSMGPLGSMVGYLFSRWYFARMERKNAMIVAGLVWMVVHSMPVLIYMLGWMPALGSWALTFMLGTFVVLVGVSVGQVVVGIGTALADIADENELATGRRQEGVFFGASAFANKCSAGLGTLLAGWVLTWIDWPTGPEIRSAADIPADTVFQLAFVSGPVIALLAIPGVLCIAGYKLDRGRLDEIQAQLKNSATE